MTINGHEDAWLAKRCRPDPGALTNLPMVGHNHAGGRLIAAKHYVAATLATENKTTALQRTPHFLP